MGLTKVTYSMIESTPANVVDFGADPTGVADSRQAIIDAMTASNVIYFPNGTYTSSGTIQVLNKDIEIIGNGATLTFTAGYLSLGGSIGSTYTLAANADFGANVFTVTGGNFAAGDIMQLVNTTPYSLSLHREYYHEGQLFTVVSAVGNVITTAENSLDIWTTGANITVKKISPVKITIRDLHVFAPNTASSTYATRIIYAKDFYTENSTYSGGDAAGLSIADSSGAVVIGCKCTCTAPVTSGLQYGISIDDSSNVLIDGCELYGTRHATGLGGAGDAPPAFITIRNSTLSNSQLQGIYSADIHGNCSYVTYQNNTIYGGASVAGQYASYLNNLIFASPSDTNFWPAIDFTEVVGGNFIIDGNQIYMPTTNNDNSVISTTSSSFLSKINYNYHIQITNNEISCSANQVSIVILGTHYLAPTVQPSVTWENNKFRNDCSSVTRIVHIASIINPATSTYVAATGPFYIKDFTPHGTMTSSVRVFSVSQGTIASGANFILPEQNFYHGFSVTSGTSYRDDTITYPYDYGSIVPPVQATLANTTVQNGNYLFAGVNAATTTGFTGLVTTGNTGATLSATTTYYANFRVGGPVTK